MSAEPASPAPRVASAPRQARGSNPRRELILDAATILMNRHGVRGMKFAEVAKMVDLNTTGVTYYFRFKEQLAAAVFEQTLSRVEQIVEESAREATPRARVRRLIALVFEVYTLALRKQGRTLASLADMRALEEPARSELAAQYQKIFNAVMPFFGPPGDESWTNSAFVRTHILLETLLWVPSWLGDHSIHDFERIQARLFDVFENGIAPSGVRWAPSRIMDLDDPDEVAANGRLSLLRAATPLINRFGYRATSVERVVAELNVTKGSFYHYLGAKNDLVFECFVRSGRRVSSAQKLASAAYDNQWQVLSCTFATLLNVQFYTDWPLLRSTAIQALPSELRLEMLDGANRLTLRFASMLVDGMMEGSIRTLDANIASRIIMTALEAAFELREWASGLPPQEAIGHYATALSNGLFVEP